MARQDVEDDIGRINTIGDGFGAGRLDSSKAVAQRRGKDLDHLAPSIVRALSRCRTRSRLAGKSQSLNGAPFLGPGFLASTGT